MNNTLDNCFLYPQVYPCKHQELKLIRINSEPMEFTFYCSRCEEYDVLNEILEKLLTTFGDSEEGKFMFMIHAIRNLIEKEDNEIEQNS